MGVSEAQGHSPHPVLVQEDADGRDESDDGDIQGRRWVWDIKNKNKGLHQRLPN